MQLYRSRHLPGWRQPLMPFMQEAPSRITCSGRDSHILINRLSNEKILVYHGSTGVAVLLLLLWEG